MAQGSVDYGQVFTFTQADLTFVADQLAAEISDLQKVGDYMGPLREALFSNNNSTALEMIGAAATVASALSAPTTASVTVNLAASVNILRGTTAILSLVAPEAAPVFTMAAATMWLATAASPLDTSTGIPSPFHDVTTTLADLTSTHAAYGAGATDGFDEMMDNIYSDWSKLDAVPTNVLNAWVVKKTADWDDVTNALTQSAGADFYTELIASVYSVDVFVGQPASVTAPSGIGSVKVGTPPCHGQCPQSCDALYSSSLPANGWVQHGLGPTHDFLIIGGAISHNNTNAMKETLPTSDILNTLFGTSTGDLNLYNDLFFAANGILPRRVGTSAPGFSGGTLCYNF